MRPNQLNNYIDAARWAEFQAGVLSRRQLLMADWSDARIRTNLVALRWRRLFPGTYNTVTGAPSIHAWWWAAHLYCGDDSRLSGLSALQAWGLLPRRLPVHIAVPARHRLPAAPDDLMIVRHERPRGVSTPRMCPPTITVEEALLDATAALADPQDVMALITDVGQRRPDIPRRLAKAVDVRQRMKHRRLIAGLIAEMTDGATTMLEIPGVRRILRAHGLPPGSGQVRENQGGAIAVRDRVIEQFGLVIEFDGRLGHADPRGRFRDHRRDNAVALSGRTSLRFGWTDVFEEACESARQVATLLSASGWTGVPTACGTKCTVTTSVSWNITGGPRQGYSS